MTPDGIHERLAGRFPSSIVDADLSVKTPWIKVKADAILPVMRFLKDDADCRFDQLLLITGVDLPDHFESVYHLASTEHRHLVAIKADLPREAPEIESVVPIWPAADWHEREQFDLVGIIYLDHPDLRRILCPEDWDGHPLRKDYRQPVEYHGIENQRRIGDDWYPKPDEDEKALVAYKPRPAAKSVAPKDNPAGE